MSFSERAKKYNQYNRYSNKNMNKSSVIFGMDDVLIDLFCSYAVSDNKTIHSYSLTNLQKLIDSIDESNFDKNQSLLIKFKFLKLALEARKMGLTRELILSDISRKMNIDQLFSDSNFCREINNDEVKYTEETIGHFLNTALFDSKIDMFMKLCQEYQKAQYIERENCLKKIRNNMKDTMAEFRRNDASESSSSTRFRLSKIEDSIEDIHKYITNPSFKLVTGMQGMNGLLGGGFQKTKVYCFFGMSGEGKTTTLTNIFYQVWKHNKGYKTTDPTKKPCIILFTMENLVIEYICNLFNILTQGQNIKNCKTAKDALNEFKKRKFEYLGDGDIEILIDYKAVGTKDVSYCYQLIEEMEDEGYETIMFFMDYLMRINPINYYPGDLYNNLGNVVNEFKVLAIEKGIPVATASQLNREAAKIIDEGRNKEQRDLIKKLGRATIGDSVQIDRNLDCLIILVPEYDAYGTKYMAYRLVKHRYEVFVPYSIIYQPFYPQSPIGLIEDVFDYNPLFKVTLEKNNEEIQNYFKNTEKIGIAPLQTNNILEMVDHNNIIDNKKHEEEAIIDISKMIDNKPIDKKEITFKPPDNIENIENNDNIPVLKKEIVTTIPINTREQLYEIYFPNKENPFKKLMNEFNNNMIF